MSNIIKGLNEGLADEFMAMAKAKGYNPRLRGTPDEERARTDAMLKQREVDRTNAPKKTYSPEEIAQIKQSLEKAKQGFDPNYEYSDDHSYWSAQNQKSKTINSLTKRLKDAGENVDEAKQQDFGPKYQSAVSALKQMAKQGERKTVWDPVKRVYKTVPVNPQKEGVAEGSEEDSYSDKFVQSQIDYYRKHGLSGTRADRERMNGSLNYYQHIKNKRIKDGTWQEQGVAEGSQESRLQPGTSVMIWTGPPSHNPPRDDKKYWKKGVVLSEPEMMTGSWQVLVKTADKQWPISPNRVFVLNQGVAEDWQKVNKSDKTDGMSPKAVKAYRRENPGSKLKTAVTKKPSELKAGSKDANRRKSFCARMSGMKKAHASAKTKRDPDSPINKALRRWNCESVEQMQELIMIAEQKISEAKSLKQQAAIAIAKKAKKG